MIKGNNYTVYTTDNLNKQNEENMSPWQLILYLLLKPHVKSERTDFGITLSLILNEQILTWEIGHH